MDLHKGDDEYAGFSEAYLAYRTAIYNYVLGMLRNEADAEDLTVAAFEKALRAWARRPSVVEELRPWLFRIATNACLDELRRRRLIHWHPWEAFISVFHPSQVAPDDPEREYLQREKADLVQAALSKLSPRDRAAMIMRECHGLSTAEIGSALGISRDATKIALFRARERLRVSYLQLGGEPRETGREVATRGSAAGSGPGSAFIEPASGDPK